MEKLNESFTIRNRFLPLCSSIGLCVENKQACFWICVLEKPQSCFVVIGQLQEIKQSITITHWRLKPAFLFSFYCYESHMNQVSFHSSCINQLTPSPNLSVLGIRPPLLPVRSLVCGSPLAPGRPQTVLVIG